MLHFDNLHYSFHLNDSSEGKAYLLMDGHCAVSDDMCIDANEGCENEKLLMLKVPNTKTE